MILFISFSATAQTTVQMHKNNVSFKTLVYPPDSLQPLVPQNFFTSTLGLSSKHEFLPLDTVTSETGSVTFKFQQYYKRLKVVNAAVATHYRNGLLASYTGFYLPIADSFDTVATLTPAAAESIYRDHFEIPENDTSKIWVVKMIIENPDANGEPANLPLLCYKIVAADYSTDLYINAHTGAILYEKERYHAGNFQTKYYGNKQAPTHYATPSGSPYNISGYLLQKMSPDAFTVLDHYYGYPYPDWINYSNIFDQNDNWTLAEHPRNYAFDAFWGLTNIMNYFHYNHNFFGTNGYEQNPRRYRFFIDIDVENYRGILNYDGWCTILCSIAILAIMT